MARFCAPCLRGSCRLRYQAHHWRQYSADLIAMKLEVNRSFSEIVYHRPLARISHAPGEMRTECRHPSGLAAKAFAPASRSQSGVPRVTFSQIAEFARTSG
jgi:hypothetical protein